MTIFSNLVAAVNKYSEYIKYNADGNGYHKFDGIVKLINLKKKTGSLDRVLYL